MELEEMKKAWLSLSEKVDAKEKLSDIFIREMYQTKVKKSLNVLLRNEYFGVIVCLFLLPFMVWKFTQFSNPLIRTTLLYWAAFGIAGVIWQLVKISRLVKVDLMNRVKENLLLISNYRAMINKEKLYASLFGAVGVIPFFFIFLGYSLWRWTAMFSWLIFILLLVVWQYKRLYGPNIRSIQQNLQELEELEE